MALYHHQSTRKTSMEFHNRLWLIPIYQDHSPTIIVQKASQISITELMLCELFSQAMQGRSTLYVLPTDNLVYRFTPRRIDRLVNRVEFYRDNCGVTRKASDTKMQKTIFGVDCAFVGSGSALNFYEIPCDNLIIDEHDKCNQDNLRIAHDRLESATNPLIRIIGNPSVESEGINDHFEKSDAKEWFIRCDHCGERQPLDWFVNIVREESTTCSLVLPSQGGGDAGVACRRCSKAINRLAPGEWVARHQDRDVSGYHCNSIFGNPLPGTINRLYEFYLIGRTNLTAKQTFWNNRLGLPFTAAGNRLDEKVLKPCEVDYEMPLKSEVCFGGVDVGSVLHVEVSSLVDGKQRLVFAGTLPLDLNALHEICVRYNIRNGMIDALPETKFSKDFVRDHPGWYRCYYGTTDDKDMAMKIDYVERKITVGRTESFDMSLAEYLEQRMQIPRNWRSLDNGDFVKQMKAPTRVYQEPKGNSPGRYVWTEGSQADHYRHADNYRAIAARLYGGGGSLVTVV